MAGNRPVRGVWSATSPFLSGVIIAKTFGPETFWILSEIFLQISCFWQGWQDFKDPGNCPPRSTVTWELFQKLLHGHTQALARQDPPLYRHFDPGNCPPRSTVKWVLFQNYSMVTPRQLPANTLRCMDTLTLAIAHQDPLWHFCHATDDDARVLSEEEWRGRLAMRPKARGLALAACMSPVACRAWPSAIPTQKAHFALLAIFGVWEKLRGWLAIELKQEG